MHQRALRLSGNKMGRLNVSIKDKIEAEFREEVFKRKGMKKGNLTKAVEEAMLLWISVPKKHEPNVHKS